MIPHSTNLLSRPNLTDTANLPKTKVNVQTYHNVYVYSARNLWIAYAFVITGATIAVAIGLYTIFTTGAWYSNEFSTILRVGRHAVLDKEVLPDAADGRDPLPEYLAKATLMVVKPEKIELSLVQRTSAATASSHLLASGEEGSLGTRVMMVSSRATSG